MHPSRAGRLGLYFYGILILAFLYLPLVAIGFASVSTARYLSFPIRQYTTQWYAQALESGTVSDLLWISLQVALIVTVISMVLGFFGALAFARYHWRYRRLYQKLILLPIFFPQSVLGLAALVTMSTLGISPSWKTAVFMHLVWVVPIVTMIVSIRLYGFDVAQEEAAFDLGATRFQSFLAVTLPQMMPGIVSGALFVFLLSWANLPLSAYTSGADSTLPEWLYSRMSTNYAPMVPAVSVLSIVASVVAVVIFQLIRIGWRRHLEERNL